MKYIVLKRLTLTNFKGIRSLDIAFDERVTTISGRNGSGKTTIMDAFTWLLFGKDSQDRKQFSIKTLDENGVAIPQLPHEVSATLLVDGKEVLLRRCYNEIWRKRQGSSVTEFDGHNEERFYNDVPCSVREWSDKINAIVDETVFKYITNPSYFPTRKPDVQRNMLFQMAGNISDEEIAQGNEAFAQLLKDLDGKTMEEYKKEIGAKKRRLKEEAEGIPFRIDECKRSMPANEDWKSLEESVKANENELSGIEKQLNDIAKLHRADDKKRNDLAKQLSTIEREKQQRIHEIDDACSKEYYDALQKKSDNDNKIHQKEWELQGIDDNIAKLSKTVSDCDAIRNQLIAAWKNINAMELQFDDSEFICPTCKRLLDPSDIESKKAEMIANHNERKAKLLRENKEQGIANNEKKQKASAEIEVQEKKKSELQAEIERLKSAKFNTPQAPNSQEKIDNDEKVKECDRKIAEINAELDKPVEYNDEERRTGLESQKTELQNAITDLKVRISHKADIERNQNRIADLERQLLALNESIAGLEGIEMNMLDFSKAKAAAIESKVNGLFHIVRFKMFDTLVNGAEVETCVATVNGVPYNDGLNAAGMINAGLDIINAICRHQGVHAPIMVDNCESINNVLDTESQQIRLYVTDTDLQIKQPKQ